MRLFLYLYDDHLIRRPIPNPGDLALDGIPWGRPDTLFTPAYWLTQYWMNEESLEQKNYRFGETLLEEIIACVLGGYGVSAEIAWAAFERLRDSGVLEKTGTSVEVVSNLLRQPLTINGRTVTYRFWSRKAHFIVSILSKLSERPAPVHSSFELRSYLVGLPGIGLKTASWIVRNWLGSSDIAILDIHVIRAGQLMGLYNENIRIEREYLDMEQRFLDLATNMKVAASGLDLLIWNQMRQNPRVVSNALGNAALRSGVA